MSEEQKKQEELKPGFLPADDFLKKYDAITEQKHPITYLEEVSDEDRELYTSGEILSGRGKDGRYNKFWKMDNTGKKYNTLKIRFMNSLKRYVDDKITSGKETELWDKLWDGDSQYTKMLMERIAGKVEENINVKSEEKITFTLGPDKNALDRQKKNLGK